MSVGSGFDDLAPDDIAEGMRRVVAETRKPQRFRERLLRANPQLKERLEMPEPDPLEKYRGNPALQWNLGPEYTVLNLDAVSPLRLPELRHVYKRLCAYADLKHRLALLQGAHLFTVENSLSIRGLDGKRLPRKVFKEVRGLVVGMARIWNDLPEWARWPKEFRQDWRLPKGVTGPAIVRHLHMASHMHACAVGPEEHCTCGLNAIIRAFEQQEGV